MYTGRNKGGNKNVLILISRYVLAKRDKRLGGFTFEGTREQQPGSPRTFLAGGFCGEERLERWTRLITAASHHVSWTLQALL